MRLIIIGAGGHGQVVADAAKKSQNYESIYFLDDRFKEVGNEVQKYGTINYKLSGSCESFKDYIDGNTEFYPAFGNNGLRLDWENDIISSGGKLAVIIHPTATVSSSASIGKGSVILANAVVNPGATIGRACIVNSGSIIDHGCVISDGCHINCGAVVLGENVIPPFTKVDAGEVIPARKWI